MMPPEIEKKVDEALAALTGMFREKQIEPDSYYKCILCLAYEFAVAGSGIRAVALTQGIPAEYFRDVMGRQMVEDGNFSYVAYTLSLSLMQQGFVHLGAPVTPTMPVAQA